MKLLNFIKKNVLLVAALATVIGFSAFKVVDSKVSDRPIAGQYWNFTGGNPQDANNYTPAPVNSSCEDGETVCQIFAESDGNPANPKPMLSAPAPNHGAQTVSQRITEALQSKEANETVTLFD